MCYGPHAITHRGLKSSRRRMERGEVQDMKRRGKGDGGNKRNAGDKISEGGKRQQEYEHYVLSTCMYCTVRDNIPHIGR